MQEYCKKAHALSLYVHVGLQRRGRTDYVENVRVVQEECDCIS